MDNDERLDLEFRNKTIRQMIGKEATGNFLEMFTITYITAYIKNWIDGIVEVFRLSKDLIVLLAKLILIPFVYVIVAIGSPFYYLYWWISESNRLIKIKNNVYLDASISRYLETGNPYKQEGEM